MLLSSANGGFAAPYKLGNISARPLCLSYSRLSQYQELHTLSPYPKTQVSRTRTFFSLKLPEHRKCCNPPVQMADTLLGQTNSLESELFQVKPAHLKDGGQHVIHSLGQEPSRSRYYSKETIRSDMRMSEHEPVFAAFLTNFVLSSNQVVSRTHKFGDGKLVCEGAF